MMETYDQWHLVEHLEVQLHQLMIHQKLHLRLWCSRRPQNRKLFNDFEEEV